VEPDVAREGFRLAAGVDLGAGEVPDQREFLSGGWPRSSVPERFPWTFGLAGESPLAGHTARGAEDGSL
jgi:hypothetical protein